MAIKFTGLPPAGPLLGAEIPALTQTVAGVATSVRSTLTDLLAYFAANYSANTIHAVTGDPGGSLGTDGDFALDSATQLFYGPKAGGVWPAGVSYKGDAGSDGNTLLTTSGAPSSGTGKNGDYAIDSTAQLIYGPKAGGGWPAGVSYKGSTGAAGNTMLATTGAPGAGVGNNGDFANDAAASVMYGPKVSGAWPAGVSYKGATGATGTSINRTAGTVSVAAGVATVDIAGGAEVFVLPQLTANVTSWVWTTLPASGKYADLSIITQQGASTAYTIADPGAAHHQYGGAWTNSSVLGIFETLGIRLWHDGTVERFYSGVGG